MDPKKRINVNDIVYFKYNNETVKGRVLERSKNNLVKVDWESAFPKSDKFISVSCITKSQFYSSNNEQENIDDNYTKIEIDNDEVQCDKNEINPPLGENNNNNDQKNNAEINSNFKIEVGNNYKKNNNKKNENNEGNDNKLSKTDQKSSDIENSTNKFQIESTETKKNQPDVWYKFELRYESSDDDVYVRSLIYRFNHSIIKN